MNKRDTSTVPAEDIENVRRSIVASQLGVDFADVTPTREQILELLALPERDPYGELTLAELFDSTDQSEYRTLSRNAELKRDDRLALFDLQSRVHSPIEYCQLDDGKWSVRLKLRNSIPIAGIASSLAQAVKRIEITLRLVPTQNRPRRKPSTDLHAPQPMPIELCANG